MNRQRKILTAWGAVLIVCMLLVAVFALGVYVGEHGWTREGLSLRGAQRPVNQPNQPAANPDEIQAPGLPAGAPLPGGQPKLVGRVQRVARDRLEIATQDGPRTVNLTPRTRFEDQGQVVDLQAVQWGQMIAVFGEIQGDGRTLVAQLVVLLPPPENPD